MHIDKVNKSIALKSIQRQYMFYNKNKRLKVLFVKINLNKRFIYFVNVITYLADKTNVSQD